MAPIPSSASTISPSFVETHRPEGRGAAFKDPILSHRDRQAPRSHVFMDQDSEEGSKFVAEKLIPLRTFSPEKLVPRYPMDSSASSPQGYPPTKNLLSPPVPVDYTEGGCQQGLPGALAPYPFERAGDPTHSSNPSVEEFIARQSAKARPRPPYWKTQCHWTMKPLGDSAGSCHYGRSCLYGHDGDVYKDNLSVYYTFENGRSCPNFVSPATPSPPLGAQSLSSPPWVVPEATPQAQALQTRESNQVLGDPGASDSRNAPGHCDMEGGAPMEAGAPVAQPDFPWLHESQQAALNSGQLASPIDASFTVDESLFRLEPRISVADYILGYYNNEFQSQTVDNIVANMEAQYPMSDGSGPDSF